MTSKISAHIMPPVSQEFADELVRVFAPRPIKDDMTLIAIGREAGKQEVLRYVKQHVRKSIVSGNPDDIDPVPQKLNFFQRLFNGH